MVLVRLDPAAAASTHTVSARAENINTLVLRSEFVMWCGRKDPAHGNITSSKDNSRNTKQLVHNDTIVVGTATYCEINLTITALQSPFAFVSLPVVGTAWSSEVSSSFPLRGGSVGKFESGKPLLTAVRS